MSNLPATREKLHATLQAIEEKLSGLKALESQTYKTDGKFRFNPTYTANDPIYIHKSTDLAILLSIYAYIKAQAERYNDAAKECGLTSYPNFQWMSYGEEAWLHDVKMRIGLVSHDTQITKLRTAKSQLSQFLTEEDRLALVLEGLKELV